MTDVAALGARRCRGCGVLLHARDRCACDTATVHVITTLGPTDGPGLIVPARLGPIPQRRDSVEEPSSAYRQYLTDYQAYRDALDQMARRNR